MNTPICDFVQRYVNAQAVRLHMPGHKGRRFVGPEALDITEIPGADALYCADGIIEESQKNAASLFGSGKTLYSCEGSSLAVRAMLYLALLARGDGGSRPVVLAGRNAHRVFVSAAALLDFDIEWLFSETPGGLLSCAVSAAGLEEKLRAMPEKPAAVYLTSPDYIGNILDSARLSAVCRRFGVPLLVDNAHGAYLRFLPESMHPLGLGADMCCDSAHKTLPALTGAAYLHISASAPAVFSQNAMRAMALFASTSPSYLILQSLDRTNAYLAAGYPDRLDRCARRLSGLKSALRDKGFALWGDEPLKITVAPKASGYTGTELAQYLRARRIECEFADPDCAVFMFTPELTGAEIDCFEAAMLSLGRRAPIPSAPPVLRRPERAATVRRAVFAPSCVLPAEQCLGRVLASENIACPPAVPVAVAGERLDASAVEALRYYGVSECRVLAE